MKYIFLTFVICFLWFSSMALVTLQNESVRIENKELKSCRQKVIDCNREVNQIWKEKNFWIKEAKRKK